MARLAAIGCVMFKFALALGILYQWLTGPDVASLPSFGAAAARTFMATLVAWMVLEAMRALVRAVQTLDDGSSRTAE